jgi:hypothetical protein
LIPRIFTVKKTEKKNPKNKKLAIRINSLHKAGRNSFGRNFLFRRMVATAESAIVKLAMLALTAKMIRGECDIHEESTPDDKDNQQEIIDLPYIFLCPFPHPIRCKP